MFTTRNSHGIHASFLFLVVLAVGFLPGCRTFDPVDSFNDHFKQFKKAYAKEFERRCPSDLDDRAELLWLLDDYKIGAMGNLAKPYRAVDVRLKVCLSAVAEEDCTGKSMLFHFGWEYDKGTARWRFSGSVGPSSLHRGVDYGKWLTCASDIAKDVNKNLTR